MKPLYIIIFSIVPFLSFAQQPANKEKASNYYFYKKDGVTEVATKDSADIIQIISEPDSGETLYNVQEFFKNGKPKLLGKSSSVHPILLQGQCVNYYSNGKKKLIADYKFNTPKGKTYRFYPNGKPYIIMDVVENIANGPITKYKMPHNDSVFVAVYDSGGVAMLENGNGYYKRFDDDFKTVMEEGTVKNSLPEGTWKGYDDKYHLTYTEQYIDGKLISATSKDSAGLIYSYKERSTPAQFSKDPDGIGKFLGRTIRYPVRAYRNGSQGRVFCQFIISTTGKLYKFKVVRPGYSDLDNEALRILALMPNWIPATYRGKPVEEFFTVPISFSLGNSPR